MATVVLLLAACADQAARDNARWISRHECEKRPQSEYEECVERARAAGDEYDRAREEASER